MADYILDIMNQTSKLDWALPFQRTEAFPLDRSSLFSSLDDAKAYASGIANDERGLGGSSYIGQPISVYDVSTNTVALYIIDTNRNLKEVGSSQTGDNLSIEIINGKIQLKEFGVGYYSFVPAEVNEEGQIIKESSYVYTEGFKEGLIPKVISNNNYFSIAWYEPSESFPQLDLINIRVNAVEDNVQDIHLELEKTTTNIENIQEELKIKVNSDEVYTKEETQSIIKETVNDLDHLKRTIVDNIESIDVNAKDAERYIYMVTNGESYDEYMVINKQLEKVGDWSVDLDSYATKEELNQKASAESVTILQSSVSNLNDILKGTDSSTGLVNKVISLDTRVTNLELSGGGGSVGDNYVTKILFNSTVANLSTLINANTANIAILSDQIDVLDKHLSWQELQ